MKTGRASKVETSKKQPSQTARKTATQRNATKSASRRAKQSANANKKAREEKAENTERARKNIEPNDGFECVAQPEEIPETESLSVNREEPPPADPQALLAKFGLTNDAAVTQQRLGANLRSLATGLVKRVGEVVKHSVSVVQAMGMAAYGCATLGDLRQFTDFASKAIQTGQTGALLTIGRDVLEFIVEYPDDARKVMSFINAEKARIPQMTKQQSVWMSSPVDAASSKAPSLPKEVDFAVVGGGLSGAHTARAFAEAEKAGNTKGQKLLVIERDTENRLEQAASMRNAGMVCTALDYLFGPDEILGDKAIERIQKALMLDRPQAEKVYTQVMSVMAEATTKIKAFLKKSGADVDFKHAGAVDLASSHEVLAEYRKAVAEARRIGFDWSVVDAEVLKERGIESPGVVGAMVWNDSAQLHPAKLVKALFEYAQKTSKNVQVAYGTDCVDFEPHPKGGYVLHLRQRGPDGKEVLRDVHAKKLVQATEATSPLKFRQARISQIHEIQVTKGANVEALGSVCHGFTYIRDAGGNGCLLVGSGDLPASKNPKDNPALLMSAALYAFACFKKLAPNAEFDMKKAWSGMFGLNESEIPCVGTFLKDLIVTGGYGGSGQNFSIGAGEQVVAELLGQPARGPMSAEGLSPRQFAMMDLRHDLAEELKRIPQFRGITPERVKVKIGAKTSSQPVRRGDSLEFTVDEKTFDAANVLAADLFPSRLTEEMSSRAQAKMNLIAAWVDSAERFAQEQTLSGGNRTLELIPQTVG